MSLKADRVSRNVSSYRSVFERVESLVRLYWVGERGCRGRISSARVDGCERLFSARGFTLCAVMQVVVRR